MPPSRAPCSASANAASRKSGIEDAPRCRYQRGVAGCRGAVGERYGVLEADASLTAAPRRFPDHRPGGAVDAVQQQGKGDVRVVQHDLDIPDDPERGLEILRLGLEQDPETAWGQPAPGEPRGRDGVRDTRLDSDTALEQQCRQE